MLKTRKTYLYIKRLGLVLFSTLLFCPLFGQESRDSLFNIWNDTTQIEFVRITALIKFCDAKFLNTQPDSSINLIESSLQILKQQKKQKVTLLHKAAYAAYLLSDYSKAIQFIENTKSLPHNDRAYSFLLLGDIKFCKGNYTTALADYRTGLLLAEKNKQENLINQGLERIGQIYQTFNFHEEAILYFNKALQSTQNHNLIANISSSYQSINNFSEANALLESAIYLNEEKGELWKNNLLNTARGLNYQLTGDEQKALYYYNRGLMAYEKIKFKRKIAQSLSYIADIYANTKPDTAVFLTNQALNIAQQTKNIKEEYEAALQLAELLQKQGKYTEALRLKNLSIQLHDSIYSPSAYKALMTDFSKYSFNKSSSIDDTFFNADTLLEKLLLFLLGGIVFLASARLLLQQKAKHSNLQKKTNINQTKQPSSPTKTTATIFEKSQTATLNKEKIEKAIRSKIGTSSWQILLLLSENPSISNKELAEKMSLSIEGVSSSLRRMYTSFNIKSTGNKKVKLLMKALELSAN